MEKCKEGGDVEDEAGVLMLKSTTHGQDVFAEDQGPAGFRSPTYLIVAHWVPLVCRPFLFPGTYMIRYAG